MKSPRQSLLQSLMILLIGHDRGELLAADFVEVYTGLRDSVGPTRARWMMGIQIIASLCPILMRHWTRSIVMQLGYAKIAFRNLTRQRGYALINILGLAVGLASAILILLWVQDELGYDRYHVNGADIYSVVVNETYGDGDILRYTSTAAPLGAELVNDYPEVLKGTRIGELGNVSMGEGQVKQLEPRLHCVDPAFFEIFSHRFIQGDPSTALQKPHSLVVTQTTARRYFGTDQALGKVIRMDGRITLEVTGVIEDMPRNSTFRGNCLIPFKTLSELGDNLESWHRFSYLVYVQLIPHTDVQTLNGKIKDLVRKHNPNSTMEIGLFPLYDIHLYSQGIWGFGRQGDIRHVTVFSAVAFWVLLAACINFMNLATARSARRAKEVALRKTVGAVRSQLVRQFLGESLTIALIALAGALVLVGAILPLFNGFTGKAFTLDELVSGRLLLGILGLTVLTGIMAGIYPAFLLSSYQPAKVLGGARRFQAGHSGFRRVLVSVQFIVTIALLVSTLTISEQMRYIRQRPLGFEKDFVVAFQLTGGLSPKAEQARKIVLEQSAVQAASLTSNLPGAYQTSITLDSWDGRQGDAKFDCAFTSSGSGLEEVLRFKMVEGRFFSEEFASDSGAIVVNESAVRAMGMADPIGKRVMDRTVIGVMKDFHAASLHEKIGPLAMMNRTSWPYRYLCVRLEPGAIPGALTGIREALTRLAPNTPVEHVFLDQRLQAMYREDKRVGTLVRSFSVLLLLVTALGLLGLASFTAEQRAKEVSVRKVLGASVPSILGLLSWEFVRWVLLANVVAWPTAYYFMTRWLEGFAYRMPFNPWLYIGATLGTLVLSLIIVSVQVLRAAMVNPATMLRKE